MASQREQWPPTGAVSGERGDPSARNYDRVAAQVERPALALRARVFATRRSLDEQLADGADPAQTAALALRAPPARLHPRPPAGGHRPRAAGLGGGATSAPVPGRAVPAPAPDRRTASGSARHRGVPAGRTPRVRAGHGPAVAAADRWRRSRLRPARHALSPLRGARRRRRARRSMGESILGLVAAEGAPDGSVAAGAGRHGDVAGRRLGCRADGSDTRGTTPREREIPPQDNCARPRCALPPMCPSAGRTQSFQA
jgi:hypothetical protein